jgi:purine-binding chemotaxis protein CheW
MSEKTADSNPADLNPAESTAGQGTPAEKYLIFTIGEKLYALPSKIINEVAVLEKVFPLPLVPDYVRGIINRYSVPYALVDINFLLFKNSSSARKVIVLKQEIDKLSFLIDDVTDIADISPDKLLKIDQEETSAVTAFFEWKDTHILCLEIEELIKTIRGDFE